MKRAACRKNTFFAIEYLVKGVNAIFSILLNSVSFLIFWILSLRNDKRKRGKEGTALPETTTLGKGEEGHDALCCSVIGRIVARLLCCDSSQEDGRRRSLDEKTNLNHTHDATAQR